MKQSDRHRQTHRHTERQTDGNAVNGKPKYYL